MSLISHLKASVEAAAEKLKQEWSSEIAPWLERFLSDLWHHEVEAALPYAKEVVELAAAALAANVGDLPAAAGIIGRVISDVAGKMLANGEAVAIHSITAAVTAAVAGHPDIAAAQTAAADSAAPSG